jgi:hypothetical protein
VLMEAIPPRSPILSRSAACRHPTSPDLLKHQGQPSTCSLQHGLPVLSCSVECLEERSARPRFIDRPHSEGYLMDGGGPSHPSQEGVLVSIWHPQTPQLWNRPSLIV